MANFLTAYKRISRWEGGYQKHPSDQGNYNSKGQLVGTNWGINAKTYEDWKGYPPSATQMKNMPKLEAMEIFERRYWDKIKGNDIHDQPLADIIFDGRVNSGSLGVKLLQRVLKIEDDGIFGNQTLAAVNAANPGRLYLAYKQARADLYERLIQQNPSYEAFRKGWANRLASFSDYAGAAAAGGGILIAAVLGFLWWKYGRK